METGSHKVAQAGLEFTVYSQLALNSKKCVCLCLPKCCVERRTASHSACFSLLKGLSSLQGRTTGPLPTLPAHVTTGICPPQPQWPSQRATHSGRQGGACLILSVSFGGKHSSVHLEVFLSDLVLDLGHYWPISHLGHSWAITWLSLGGVFSVPSPNIYNMPPPLSHAKVSRSSG